MSTRKDPFIFLKQQPPLFLAYPIPSLFLHAKKYSLITYEKALLGQATGGKFPAVTFIERKQMSTKTSIKRIALVAAAALTLGGFSAVSAHAVETFPKMGTASSATTTGGTATAATATATVGTYVGETITAGHADKVYTISSSGVGSMTIASIGSDAGTTTYPAITTPDTTGSKYTVNSATSATWYTGAGAGLGGVFTGDGVFTIAAVSDVAGTQTITVKGDSSAASTLTITWGAAPAVTTQYSTAFIGVPTSGDISADATVSASSAANAASPVQAAQITVVTNSAASTPIANVPLTATVTGPGTVGIGNSTNYTQISQGKDVTFAKTVGVSKFQVSVWPDGTAGTSTITIKSGTVTIATKTLTFYSAPTAITVTQNLFVGKAGTATSIGAAPATDQTSTSKGTNTYATVALTPAFTAKLVDANGNPASGLTYGTSIKATSSNTAVITVNSCSEQTALKGTWQCQVSSAAGSVAGQSATVTLAMDSATDTAGTYSIKATPITFTVGGDPLTVAASLSSSGSFAPGAAATLTFTAKDKNGFAPYDYDYTNLLSSAGMSSTVANPATILPGAAVSLINGSSDNDIYAPVSEGDFTIAGKTGTSTGTGLGAVVSVTGTVSGTSASAGLALDAANAATDAANNAYDEAQNATQAASDALAAVTALSAQVSALIATVKSLAAMVAKIKAKVKA